MRTLEEMYELCKKIEEEGLEAASTNEIMEIVEVASVVFDNMLDFKCAHPDEDISDAAYEYDCDARVAFASMFDELDYYLQED